MDLSIVVVLLALVALVSPVWLYFTRDKDDKNQLLSYYDLILAANTVLLMQRNQANDKEAIVIFHNNRRLLLYDLIQENKTRIV